MLLEDQHPHNKSLLVAVLGRPNAGKSTLINAFLGQDLSVVTPLAQTTRNHFHCVLNVDRTELVLVDTPGLHHSNKEINKRMNQEVGYACEGADLGLLLLDGPSFVHSIYGKEYRANILQSLEELGLPAHFKIWLVTTKLDLMGKHKDTPITTEEIQRLENQLLHPLWEEFAKNVTALGFDVGKAFLLSAKSEENIHELLGAMLDVAKNSAHLYPSGDLSNKNMRFFVSEYIREQTFHLLKEELPYEIMVTVEDYLETKSGSPILAKINATIHVNRLSQRAIVIGSGGHIIKEIGVRSRKRIEELLGGQVFLNLHVKVSPKWFNNNTLLEEIGLKRAKNSNRVWRQR